MLCKYDVSFNFKWAIAIQHAKRILCSTKKVLAWYFFNNVICQTVGFIQGEEQRRSFHNVLFQFNW